MRSPPRRASLELRWWGSPERTAIPATLAHDSAQIQAWKPRAWRLAEGRCPSPADGARREPPTSSPSRAAADTEVAEPQGRRIQRWSSSVDSGGSAPVRARVAGAPCSEAVEGIDLARHGRQCGRVLFRPNTYSAPRWRIVFAMLFWHPIASMLTTAPSMSSSLSNSGIAVISLLLTSVAYCPSTQRVLAHPCVDEVRRA